ncbi:MAG: acylneuraminate cytidylyltransferase [Deltaproteobacteria bacterium RBG_13_49_15]|nr:MAG: acylneuraminate cytidylyltransferase [Deltaproteobacteria bacterium RBG_13_49_15]
MIRGKTVLAVITARGGSKGLPGKNIRPIAGKPLIAWSIEEAKKSRYIDRLILSSEDDEIIAVAKQWGCEVPFVRPAELATDDIPGVEPILHALGAIPEKYDYVVLLQPTSPFRLAEDIDGCIEICLERHAFACVSVTEPDKSPYWMYNLNEKGFMVPVTNLGYTTSRRQDLPPAYAINGAVYVADTVWLKEQRAFLSPETVAFIMPRERSYDIDTELDLKICDMLMWKHKI